MALGVSTALAAQTRRRVQAGELPADFTPEWRARRDAPGRYRVQRWRSLAVLRPDLVAELHPTRNGDRDPHALAPTSSRRVWWRCASCSHEWQLSPRNRTGCPWCAAHRVPRERSLAILHPDLAAQLHPARNDDLDPDAVALHSRRIVWRRCPGCGREWKASIRGRAGRHGRCPRCRREAVEGAAALVAGPDHQRKRASR